MSKFLLLCFIICFATQTFCITRITEEVKDQCRQETEISLQESRVLKSNEVLTPKKKCYIKCLFEKGGYLDKDGTVLVDQMRSDRIADGDNERLKNVFSCAEKINQVKSCDKITDLIDCFTL